ncbi:MAG: aminopeptidase, partial [Oscillospiraceae bacterium]|nr:aminopeptidase [Oscillospiraceae bacterium]
MDAKEWKEKLLTQKKNGYDRMPAQEREAMDAYCAAYKAFLDAGKTERECVREGIRQAREKGFQPYARGMELKAGDKVYLDNRGKMLV